MYEFYDKTRSGKAFKWGFSVHAIPDCCSMTLINSLWFREVDIPYDTITDQYALLAAGPPSNRLHFKHNTGTPHNKTLDADAHDIYHIMSKVLTMSYSSLYLYAYVHHLEDDQSVRQAEIDAESDKYSDEGMLKQSMIVTAIGRKWMFPRNYRIPASKSQYITTNIGARYSFYDYASTSKIWQVANMFPKGSDSSGINATDRRPYMYCATLDKGVPEGLLVRELHNNLEVW